MCPRRPFFGDPALIKEKGSNERGRVLIINKPNDTLTQPQTI